MEGQLFIEAAAGDKQRHPHSLAVGDIAVFDLTVIHQGPSFLLALTPLYTHWRALARCRKNRRADGPPVAFAPVDLKL